MKFKTVNKNVQMGLDEIIKFQLVIHCYIKNINVSEFDLNCLVELGMMKDAEVTEFCNIMAERRWVERMKTWKPDDTKPDQRPPEKSPQSIRNILIRAEKDGLITKNGKYSRKIQLNPEIHVQTEDSILLNYKIFHIGTQEIKGTDK